MQHPSWARQNPKAPAVAEQITIMKIRPKSTSAQTPLQLPFSGPLPPMSMDDSSSSRCTGAGVDGVIEPTKMTGQVHEGEGVLNANAMQSLTPEEFYALSKALENGTINKNALRQSIGMQPVSGYSQGGIVGFNSANDITLNGNTPTSRPVINAAPPTTNYSPTVHFNSANDITLNGNTPTSRQVVNSQAPSAPAPSSAPVRTAVFPKETIAPVQHSAPSINIASPTFPKTIQAPAPQLNVSGSPTPASTPATEQAPVATIKPEDTTPKTVDMSKLPSTIAPVTYQAPSVVAPPAAAPASNQAYNPLSMDTYENKLMTDQSAADAASQAALGQKLIQQGASTGRQNAAMAEMDRNQENAQNRLQSNLAQKNIENQSTANTLVTQAATNASDRITQMTNGGLGLSAMENDPTLVGYIQKKLGGNATPEQVKQEIDMLYNGTLDVNKGNFNKNITALLGDAIDNKMTQDQIINDPSIRRSVAGFSRLDPTDEKNSQAITDAVNQRYATASQSSIDKEYVQVKNLMDSSPQYAAYENIPGFTTDLRNALADLKLQGATTIDENGNLVVNPTAAGGWPWNNPKTYLKYNDWNGNPIDPTKPIDPASPLNIKGNGSTYKDASGAPITNEAATQKWNGLSLSEQEKFMKNGKLDTAAFLRDQFPTTTGADGKPVPLTTYDAFAAKVAGDSQYATQVGDLVNKWSSKAAFPSEGEPGYTESMKGNEGAPLGSNYYQYYDENGTKRIVQKDENESAKLAYIFQQLGNKFNNGNLPTADQLITEWSDGKGWRVDDSGKILNIDNREGSTPVTDKTYNILLPQWDATSQDKPSTDISNALKKVTIDNAVADRKTFMNGEIVGEPYMFDDPNSPIVKGKAFSTAGGMNMYKIGNSFKGKLYKAKNGNTYQLLGSWKGGPEGDALIFRDMATNQIVEHNNTNMVYKPIGLASDGKWNPWLAGLPKVTLGSGGK